MKLYPIGNGMGDHLMLTAFVREYKRAWPEELLVVDQRCHPWIWKNNPWINWGKSRGVGRIVRLTVVHGRDREMNVPSQICAEYNIIPKSTSPELFLDEKEEGYGPLVLGDLPRPIVALDWHAMDDARKWPLNRFQALVGMLREAGITTVEIGGHEAKLNTDRALCRGVHYRQTAAILKACDLYVGNDSGSFHMAAAVGIPQVVIFGVVKSSKRAYKNTHSFDNLMNVNVETVLDAVQGLI